MNCFYVRPLSSNGSLCFRIIAPICHLAIFHQLYIAFGVICNGCVPYVPENPRVFILDVIVQDALRFYAVLTVIIFDNV